MDARRAARSGGRGGSMKRRLTWAVFVGLVLSSGAIHSQTTDQGYSAANLYNLANSYARQGKLGMAVLNYERASLLSPNDPDVEANLRYVRAASHVPEPPQSAFDRMARRG